MSHAQLGHEAVISEALNMLKPLNTFFTSEISISVPKSRSFRLSICPYVRSTLVRLSHLAVHYKLLNDLVFLLYNLYMYVHCTYYVYCLYVGFMGIYHGGIIHP